jgi:hypothetical protein
MSPRNFDEHSEKAYAFFQSHCGKPITFTLLDLQNATDYSNSTVTKYIGSRWRWFLQRQEDKSYLVTQSFAGTSKEDFISGHSQKWHGPMNLEKAIQQEVTQALVEYPWLMLLFGIGMVLLGTLGVLAKWQEWRQSKEV